MEQAPPRLRVMADMLSSDAMPTADATIVLLATAGWFLIACLVGLAGVLGGARAPVPQVLIAALTAAVLLTGRAAPPVRRFLLEVDLRALVLIHVSRLVGIYFLILHGRGELPWAFAVPGGSGDIAVAVASIAIGLLVAPDSAMGRRIVLAWNLFGLADILMVVATAARLGMADPASMRALLHLPLSLLPTFLVPIIIASHLVIFWRLRRPAR
ncbi:MAG TPA: hypothetical protein VEL75_03015 [Candidatus Methylomirabilis sp.]|nr:hypothetical protein [Candidatus Methylomirabilis sp.]